MAEKLWVCAHPPNFYSPLNISTGQVLAPTPEGLLKFCVDVSFKNTSIHQESGKMISAPPNQPDQAQHQIPEKLKEECARVVKGIYGKELSGFEFDSFRICWYNILIIPI
jgi:sarcosine oxidase/L-pipecolate oxidase